MKEIPFICDKISMKTPFHVDNDDKTRNSLLHAATEEESEAREEKTCNDTSIGNFSMPSLIVIDLVSGVDIPFTLQGSRIKIPGKEKTAIVID